MTKRNLTKERRHPMSNKKNYSIAQEAIIQEIREIENPEILNFLFGFVTCANEKLKGIESLKQGETAE